MYCVHTEEAGHGEAMHTKPALLLSRWVLGRHFGMVGIFDDVEAIWLVKSLMDNLPRTNKWFGLARRLQYHRQPPLRSWSDPRLQFNQQESIVVCLIEICIAVHAEEEGHGVPFIALLISSLSTTTLSSMVRFHLEKDIWCGEASIGFG